MQRKWAIVHDRVDRRWDVETDETPVVGGEFNDGDGQYVITYIDEGVNTVFVSDKVAS